MNLLEMSAALKTLNFTQIELAKRLNWPSQQSTVTFEDRTTEIEEQKASEIECLLKTEKKIDDYKKIVIIYKRLEEQRKSVLLMDRFQLSLCDSDTVDSMIFNDDVVEDVLQNQFELDSDETLEFIDEYGLRDIQHDLIEEICLKSDEASESLKSEGDLFEILYNQAQEEASHSLIFVKFCQLAREKLQSKCLGDVVNTWHVEQNKLKSSYGERQSIKSICYGKFFL